MTVEELNIKITADAENFKTAVAEANAAMETFKKSASDAGKEVTDAFSGLLDVGLTGENRAPAAETVTPAEISGRADAAASFAASAQSYEQPSAAGFAAYYNSTRGISSGTVILPEPDSRETVVGAVNGGGDPAEVQPVNITTTVQLDGDKVGESVSSYFLRRNRITNGLGS